MSRRAPTMPGWHTVALSARDVTRVAAPGIDGSRSLAGVSIDLLERQLIALMGPPGAGKSTLLRVLAGAELPDTGSISPGPIAGGGIALVARPRAAGWVPRALGRLALSERGGPVAGEGVETCVRFDSLDAALSEQPAIVLADEAGGGVWSGRERERVALLREWVVADRRAAVLVTSDANSAARADRVLFLAEGAVVGDIERPDLGEVLEAIAELDG